MRTHYWQNTTGTIESSKTVAEIRAIAIRVAYVPALIIGVGPLLPVIGMIYLAKWVENWNGEAKDDADRHDSGRQFHWVLTERPDDPPDL